MSILFLGALLMTPQLRAQEIKLNSQDEPLNEVIKKLRDELGISFSFSERLLSKCSVTDTSSYSSPEEAISKLTESCGLEYKIKNDIFIITAAKTPKSVAENKPERPLFHFTGQVLEKLTREPLPFSNIIINTTHMITDQQGRFSYTSKDSVIYVRISHVGYFLASAVLTPGKTRSIVMEPDIVDLSETTLVSNRTVSTAQVGKDPGLIKINHKIATFLPGNSDNTVFNLLRLQPGILAAGEQTKDFIIWGSYKGQSLVRFDGIPLFNISAYNDQIGAVNPLIVKDIEVLKGGYNVHMGDRIGGIVNITGKTGDPTKMGSTLNINNQSASGLINIPLKKNIVLQTAFRHTYFDKLSFESILKPLNDEDAINSTTQFSDANIKLTQRNPNGDQFTLSLIGSKDQLENKYTNPERANVALLRNQTSMQYGGSLGYSKNWSNGQTSQVLVSSSTLQSELSNKITGDRPIQQNKFEKQHSYFSNQISQTDLRIDHLLPKKDRHEIHVGGSFTRYGNIFERDTVSIRTRNLTGSSSRFSVFAKDKIEVLPQLSIEPGLRLDKLSFETKPYFQPRVTAIFQVNKFFKFNAAAGLYNQFITEAPIQDQFGNAIYQWMLSNDKNIPAIQSVHRTFGVFYDQNGLNVSVEGYYKTASDQTIFTSSNGNLQNLTLKRGNSRTYGADFFIRKKLDRVDLQLAYTLSKSEEQFTFPRLPFTGEYTPAIFDQRHEIKGATIFNFYPFFLSANYVYGSGLYSEKDESYVPYNRMDAAFLYKLNTAKIKLETGISIQNVLNNKNFKFNNFSTLFDNKVLYTQGIPFTPSVFLNIGF